MEIRCFNCGNSSIEKIDDKYKCKCGKEYKFVEVSEVHETLIKKSTKLLMAIMIISLIVTIILLSNTNSSINKYQNAIQLKNAEKYQEAKIIFSQLGDFIDSKKQVEECDKNIKDKAIYKRAQEYIITQNYYEAIQELEKVKDYKNSKALLDECNNCILENKYNIAKILLLIPELIDNNLKLSYLRLFNKIVYEQAKSVFEQLDNYKDSRIHLIECDKNLVYNEARELINIKNFEEAKSKLENLIAFKDSLKLLAESKRNISDESKYKKALSLKNKNNFVEALKEFEEIKDYKNSKDLIAECESTIVKEKYDNALIQLKNEKYSEAKALFEELGDYEDSKNKLEECNKAISVKENYEKALELINAQNYLSAKPILEQLGDYEDSKTQLEKCNKAISNKNNYDNAKVLMKAKNYKDAKNILQRIEGYNDCKDLIKKCDDYIVNKVKYDSAVELKKLGKYQESKSIFKELENFENSKEILKHFDEDFYKQALELVDKAKYNDAKIIFEQLGNYRDSNKKVVYCSFMLEVGIEFCKCQAGQFTMGSPENEEGRQNDESQRLVNLDDFFIGKYPITNKQYSSLEDFKSKENDNPDKPVTKITWTQAKKFCKKLTEKYKAMLKPGQKFDLPTEAQWEYACRAGTTGARYGELDKIAWYEGNSHNQTSIVGKKLPNSWGIYDMIGNVREFCEDDYTLIKKDKKVYYNPLARSSNLEEDIVLKGGSYQCDKTLCRAAFRGRLSIKMSLDDVGFRIVIVTNKPNIEQY